MKEEAKVIVLGSHDRRYLDELRDLDIEDLIKMTFPPDYGEQIAKIVENAKNLSPEEEKERAQRWEERKKRYGDDD